MQRSPTEVLAVDGEEVEHHIVGSSSRSVGGQLTILGCTPLSGLAFRLSTAGSRARSNGVQSKRVWARVVGVERNVVVEAVEFDDEAGEIVVSCRLRRGAASRCGECGRRCGRYDRGEGRRRWRALDAGTVRVFIEADAPRVACLEHGVTVAAVPWARHGAGHTRPFDDQVAWLVTHCSMSAVVELMRVAWRTVGEIATRAVVAAQAVRVPFDRLVRNGMHEGTGPPRGV